MPSSRPFPLSHRSTERPTASVTAPSTHFIPPTLVSFSHTPGGTAVTRRNPPPSGPVLVWALGPLFLLCPKKERRHRAPPPESWGFPLLGPADSPSRRACDRSGSWFPRSHRSTRCAQLGTVPALSDGETRAFPCQPSAKPDLRSWRNEIELLATAANLSQAPDMMLLSPSACNRLRGTVPLRPSHSVKSEPEGLYPHLARLIVLPCLFNASTKLTRSARLPLPNWSCYALVFFFFLFVGSRSSDRDPDHRFRTHTTRPTQLAPRPLKPASASLSTRSSLQLKPEVYFTNLL